MRVYDIQRSEDERMFVANSNADDKLFGAGRNPSSPVDNCRKCGESFAVPFSRVLVTLCGQCRAKENK